MIIWDTCVWIALLNKEDTLNLKAKELIKDLDWNQMVLPDLIFYEVLTVLKLKSELKLDLPKAFLNLLKKVEISSSPMPNEIIESSINKLTTTSEKTSFVDVCLYQWSKQKNVEIITFDESLKKWIINS